MVALDASRVVRVAVVSDTRLLFLAVLRGYVLGCRFAFPLLIPAGCVLWFTSAPWWVGSLVASVGFTGSWVAWNIDLRKWAR